jgi:hypothetical protein
MNTSSKVVILVSLFSILSFSGAGEELSHTGLADFGLNSYSWKETTSEVVAAKKSSMIINGEADPGGATSILIDLGSRQIQGYRYENKVYVSCVQRNWRSESLLRRGETPGEFMARLVRGVVPPATEVGRILKNGGKLKKAGELLSGDLTPGLASDLFAQGTERPNKSKRREPTGVGTVKIWTKGGTVIKYELNLHGKVDLDGTETEVDRTRTVEITDVGTTPVPLPAFVRKKFGLDHEL